MNFRKLIIKFFLLGIMAINLGLGLPATAQVPLKIGVLDLKAIRANSLAIKDIRTQIENYRQGFQADIKKEEDALRIANQELAESKATAEQVTASTLEFAQKLQKEKDRKSSKSPRRLVTQLVTTFRPRNTPSRSPTPTKESQSTSSKGTGQ